MISWFLYHYLVLEPVMLWTSLENRTQATFIPIDSPNFPKQTSLFQSFINVSVIIYIFSNNKPNNGTFSQILFTLSGS